jgi:serine/threonine protein kinase
MFEEEKAAFAALRKHEGMVQYLGDYEDTEIVLPINDSQGREGPGEERKHVTYNILLEYGELDLDRYFEENLPPILEGEVSDFWKDMFDVADAVKGIHEMKVMIGGEWQECYGYVKLLAHWKMSDKTSWHADIKPDNILIVKHKFKLADPGFARFVRKTEKNSVIGRDSTIIKGATTTYGTIGLAYKTFSLTVIRCAGIASQQRPQDAG